MEKTTTLYLRLAAIAAVSIILTPNAPGGTIRGFGQSILSPNSTGTIGPVGLTPAPNNDNSPGPNPNVVNYNIFWNSLGTMDVEFLIDASGGTTEYRFSQVFLNLTGVVWQEFEFELGYGVAGSFRRGSGLDGLDFDAPDHDPALGAPGFPNAAVGAATIRLSGGAIPSIGVSPFQFLVDVPDGIERFTLRQTVQASTVPEPGAILLLISGLAVLFGLRRSGWARPVSARTRRTS